MASGEAVPAAMHTVVLKVSIHCHGCKKKVRKVLKSIEGVQNVAVDAAQHMVTVTGTVDADTLIKRLHKSGKQALPLQWHQPAAKKPEAAPASAPAPEAQPAGDSGKDAAAAAAAAADKKPVEPVKEPQTKTSEKKPEAESKEEEKKEEAKKDGGESETKAKGVEPEKEAAAAAAMEAGNDEGEAKKSKSGKAEDAGEAKPVATAERTLSAPPRAAPKHAFEEYDRPYYAPQPVLSYHAAQPSASVSYYAPQPQPAYSMHQQPAAYSMEHQQQQPMQQWSPSYLYLPYPHTAPEPYYQDYYSPPGTHAPSPPPLQDSYRLFDDENPNSCSVM